MNHFHSSETALSPWSISSNRWLINPTKWGLTLDTFINAFCSYFLCFKYINEDVHEHCFWSAQFDVSVTVPIRKFRDADESPCERFHHYWANNMMTSSNGNIFRVTGPLCGEFTGPGEFPTQRPVTRSFDVYFDLRLNKRLCKQS